jgi:hypothetical protein
LPSISDGTVDDDRAAFHYERDGPQLRDVQRRIALDCDEVGLEAGTDPAQAILRRNASAGNFPG